MSDQFTIRRRQLLKAGALGAGFLAAGGAGLFSAGPMAQRLLGAAAADQLYIEVFPTSPLIMNPFDEGNPLPIPTAARPVAARGDMAGLAKWFGQSEYSSEPLPEWNIHSDGVTRPTNDSHGAVHQLTPGELGLPDPLVYHVRLEVGTHDFTNSQVLAINSAGQFIASPNGGNTVAAGTPRKLPSTIITGFNASTDGSPVGFPGPRINAAYGQPVILRFDNQMANTRPSGYSGDFGSPEWGFLTHLHNGHTAPESDGNPHYRANQLFTQKTPVLNKDLYHVGGYLPSMWVDNMYLNFPAGKDDREKQGLFWFHDHFHNHTGANVYKGMVGLFPIYDPQSTIAGRTFSDLGENTAGSLGLPGVYRPYGDGSFEMDYDIPLAFYDVRLDDGTTVHQDFHGPDYNTTDWGNVKPGQTHPEWWGQSYFKHFPNHGFVGDVMTVNGKAFPVLHVEPRRYRFRCLDASISRIYEFQLMESANGPVASYKLGYQGDDLQGQYRLPDGKPWSPSGQPAQWLLVANGGGLLPQAQYRNSFEIWPAMRREVVVDFSKANGKTLYWTNICKMPDGRMPTSPDPAYKIPMIKIVVDKPLNPAGDKSLSIDQLAKQTLRTQPDLQLVDPSTNKIIGTVPVAQAFDSSGKPIAPLQKMIDNGRQFTLQRGGGNISPVNELNDNEWGINGHPFDQTINVLDQKNRPTTPNQGVPEIWTIQNGGGGWVHPMHMHMEEHKILMRNGKPAATWQNPISDVRHGDDTGKDDVALMDPSESVMFYRNFRTFLGKYVAHCHNLAHEDHAMMFGWEIVKPQ